MRGLEAERVITEGDVAWTGWAGEAGEGQVGGMLRGKGMDHGRQAGVRPVPFYPLENLPYPLLLHCTRSFQGDRRAETRRPAISPVAVLPPVAP